MTLAQPPPIHIYPPLLNSANPWATTLQDLKALYECPSTGAVTTRTTLLEEGFAHDPNFHQYTFFNASTHAAPSGTVSTPLAAAPGESASLNNLGYSPITLDTYLEFIREIAGEPAAADENMDNNNNKNKKLFIVSVTGNPDEVAECYTRIAVLARDTRIPLAIEINLSCPNIPGKPPPAYDAEALAPYLDLAGWWSGGVTTQVPWGIKTPPYTHAGQFAMLGAALVRAAGKMSYCPISFVTATNTLGSCLVLSDAAEPRLAGSGVGGMAGAPLHPLALGNVRALREMLDAAPQTRHVAVIGVGGVEDADGYRRMRRVGAAAVGVGTALGRKGVKVFGEIEEGLARRKWEV
ncbi:dihydroorotate dehydrogenase [Hypoxylon rubiginosum]|uniref:Dihydroorotate dehydrogenase n=1 Tax=Hypoxylon rubiginosum TaxID=110542 RepID=A0ACC0DAU7_9PEZI|nr:dihydroorotate dehydrogenase [Hypoxylon rubiginosum]